MSSLDLWQELRAIESAGRLTGREQRLKDPDDATRAELQALSRALCWSGPVLADRPFRPSGMAHRVAYYAIIDALSSRESPAGVLRRVMHQGGQRDGAFGHDLAWRHTSW